MASIGAVSKLNQEEKPKLTGTVTEALPNTSFRVRLDDGREILTYLSGKMRLHYIKVMLGDKVSLELSPDGSRGRIIRRL
jgi:translation initiation factor IF-1